MQEQPSHPLRGLLLAQFAGAFNDNAWKMMVTFLAIHQVKNRVGGVGPDFEAASQTQTTIAFVVFTLPLILFSIPAGALADRWSKRSVIIALKAVEVALMLAATYSLYLEPSGGILCLVILGLMGAHSALFSPAKYGLLPEILPHDRLSSGNGLLEMWTFLAIITGTAIGGLLLDQAGPDRWTAGLFLSAMSCVGWIASWWVPRVPAARTEGGIGRTLQIAWHTIRAERVLWLSVLGLAFYWAIASLLGQNLIIYSKSVLRLSDSEAGLPLALFGFGVGAGSILAGRLSASKVEYGLIPLGAVGLAFLTLLLGLLTPRFEATLVLMIFLGISSGLIVVPLNALIQWRAPEDRRGGVIALSNIFLFAGILLGSLSADILSRAGCSPRDILVAAAMATACGTLWSLHLLPEAFLRLVLVFLTHTFYRLRVVGREHLPEKGGALLVPNHVSFVDGLFVLASIDRPVRFIVEAGYFYHPVLRPFVKALGAIPISASGGPRMILRALRNAGNYLDQGEVVCIFAEGQITRTGMLLPFRRGLERIVKGRNAEIIPVNLDRVWGSIFSRSQGRFLTKLPEHLPYPVTVSFGSPMPPGTPIFEVRRAVHELGEEAWIHRKADREPLHHSFVRAARRRPWRLALADGRRPPLSRLRALAGGITLARALRPHWEELDCVGILLPPTIEAGLVNLAAALSGKIAVNLNYTAGTAGIGSAARQARLRSAVTSRQFLEKVKVQLPDEIQPIWLEDLAASIGPGSRLMALLLALLAPLPVIEAECGVIWRPLLDDTATIIFSSGSTGEPKGVMLTHFNIDSNLDALAQVVRVDSDDRLLGILPLFHSFGYMSLWFALNNGMGIVFHPNPLDAASIGALVERYRVTLLLATPTFLQIYLRRCTPAQFGSLRLVLAGAEKLPERLAQRFEDTFGIRPLEGYGATECAPVIAASTLDFRAPGFYQPGSRRGSVGHPVPGVSVRIVDPASFKPLPAGDPGMILVRGPNLMKGYLGREDLTAAAFHDGWYVTGDIGWIDEDGFLRITDRLSRFSKIGGEMVPHGRVEDALQEASGEAAQVFAVTAVSDPLKGEKLAVLHTLDPARIPLILEQLGARGLPNLFIPRRDFFIRVEKLPVLGTGKLDLREIKRLATQAVQTGALSEPAS
ncbi:MAG: MFS transporter [Planctomycetes bacterium]|nr:MFS transporter [Planctomycetota bacterium]